MKHPLPPSPVEPTEPEIQHKAYHLWIDGGRLEGVEIDNWFTARELLRHQRGFPAGAHAVRGPHPSHPSSSPTHA
ncbi:MAG: DUF2934 domain-containing protein [Opitutaceae bacterium]